jgi:hypothetical protein
LKRLFGRQVDGMRLITAGNQNGIHAAVDAGHPLERFNRRECIQRQLLRGIQTEAAQAFGWNDRGNRESPAADRIGFATERAVRRHIAGLRQAEHDGVADFRHKLIGERLIQDDFIAFRRFCRAAIAKFPKRGRRAKQGDISSAMMMLRFAGHILKRALHHDRGNGCFEMRLKIWIGSQFFGESFSEEPSCDEHFVDPTQPIERQIAQAAAHRIAND